jgi:hypothetical protein
MKPKKDLLWCIERWDPIRNRGSVCGLYKTGEKANEVRGVYEQELIDRGFEGMEFRIYPVIYHDE